MIVFAALLFSVSLAAIGWILSTQAAEQDVLDARAQKAFDASSPDRGNAKLKIPQNRQKAWLSYEECQNNPVKLNFFMAGVRKRSFFQFGETLFWILTFSPTVLALVLVMRDQFSWGPLIKLLALILLLFGFIFISIKVMIGRRQRNIMRDLPEFFDLIVVCMEAGFNFTGALPRVLKELDPKSILVQELQVLNNEFLGGIPLSAACDRAIKRCNVADVSRALGAVSQSEKLGTSLGRTFRIHAQEVRDKLRQRVRERAHRIPIKIVFPMMLMLFGGLFSMLGGTVIYRLTNALGKAGLT